MSLLRSLGRLFTWPVRRLLAPRFADIARRVDCTAQVVRDQASATRHDLAAHVSENGAVLGGQITRSTEHIENIVDAYAAASAEGISVIGSQLRDVIEEIHGAYAEQMYVSRLNRVAEGPVEEMDGAVANLLNLAEGHRGFAAQRGLWFNPPLTLRYVPSGVELGSVNERIVESSYAFRALGQVLPPARVLDVGSVESTVPLSLASLGYDVTALDLRPYPFRHPMLTTVESRLEDWDGGSGEFDAIFCISTIEHVGLGWYGEEPDVEGADRRALARLRGFLARDGFLVLTVPYGTRSVDAVQRVYDRPALNELLDGWRIEDLTIVRQRDQQTWERVDDNTDRGVALVKASADPEA
jgi:2-polyprenyl-3-methyl-5-hydroxy-6-metoxy-1,4-benzoquinol methylase